MTCYNLHSNRTVTLITLLSEFVYEIKYTTKIMYITFTNSTTNDAPMESSMSKRDSQRRHTGRWLGKYYFCIRGFIQPAELYRVKPDEPHIITYIWSLAFMRIRASPKRRKSKRFSFSLFYDLILSGRAFGNREYSEKFEHILTK